MSTFRADLHCHSTCSDGTLTPAEIVDHASTLGLSGLSITDHDTIAAYPQVLDYAQTKGIQMVPGVEFSTYHKGESVHVLGYSFRLNDPSILELSNRHTERRMNRNLEILKLLAKHDMPIQPEEINHQDHTIGRPHIAQAMIDHGYVESIQEAFQKFIGDGKCCHTRGSPISTEETIDIIHRGGGLAIIAHPHLIKSRSIVDALLNLKFDGIECHYARFLPKDEKPWIKIATKKSWLKTGGSDFHGTVKPANPLGCSWVEEDTFNLLLKHYQSHYGSAE